MALPTDLEILKEIRLDAGEPLGSGKAEGLEGRRRTGPPASRLTAFRLVPAFRLCFYCVITIVALRFGTCPPVLISVTSFAALMSMTATLFAPASET